MLLLFLRARHVGGALVQCAARFPIVLVLRPLLLLGARRVGGALVQCAARRLVVLVLRPLLLLGARRVGGALVQCGARRLIVLVSVFRFHRQAHAHGVTVPNCVLSLFSS